MLFTLAHNFILSLSKSSRPRPQQGGYSQVATAFSPLARLTHAAELTSRKHQAIFLEQRNLPCYGRFISQDQYSARDANGQGSRLRQSPRDTAKNGRQNDPPLRSLALCFVTVENADYSIGDPQKELTHALLPQHASMYTICTVRLIMLYLYY